MLVENCKTVHWCMRNEFVKGAIELRGHNPTYLTSVSFLPKSIALTTDINELVGACDVIVLATPSIYLSDAIEKMNCNYEGKIFISAIKGIVPVSYTHLDVYKRQVYANRFVVSSITACSCRY